MKPTNNLLLSCMCVVLTAGFASICVAAGPIEVEGLLIERFGVSEEPSIRGLVARKAAMLARARDSMAARSKKHKGKDPKVVVVDCDKGKSLQDAIDSNADPVVIEVHGLCFENVVIRRRDGLTIRGTDPEFDGIRGVVADPQPFGALEVRFSDDMLIQNLSMNDSPFAGLNTVKSLVTVENCHFIGNVVGGIEISQSSYFRGFGLTISENGTDDPYSRGDGLRVRHKSAGFFTGCIFENNKRWAAVSSFGSVVSLIQSEVNGPRGILAMLDAYVDFDCYSNRRYPEHPDCSLFVDDWAVKSELHSEAWLYVSGPFTGALWADDGSTLGLCGAQQQSVEGIRPNRIFDDSLLKVLSFAEVTEEGEYIVHEGILNGFTFMEGFSRALLLGDSWLDGMLECADAADAFAQSSVQYTGGSGFCNCEHAQQPDSCPYPEPDPGE